MQVTITAAVLLLVMFLLGFVGDYILDLYLDPWNTLSPFGERPDYSLYDPDTPPTWTEHFLKGLASLGILSFARIFLSPGRFVFRWGGGLGGRTARNGRERLEDISWILILIGVGTFLWVGRDILRILYALTDAPQSVWKGTRALSRRYLNRVAERVLDVQGDDDGDDDD